MDTTAEDKRTANLMRWVKLGLELDAYVGRVRLPVWHNRFTTVVRPPDSTLVRYGRSRMGRLEGTQ